MIHLGYLVTLCLGLLGLALIDRRFGLVAFAPATPRRQSAKVLGIGVAYFAAWDLVGIALHVFFPGVSPFVTTLQLVPGFPVEEVFFLVLLCYQTLLLWRATR